MKIISGGQTGVDRAALDAALKHEIDCGGSCPGGRLDEFGLIPAHYPLKELENGGFAERTLRNVQDSNGTVIVYFDKLRGGSEQTVRFCREENRPHKLINGAEVSAQRAAEVISGFVRDQKIATLNIAGPRQSEWREGYDYAFRAFDLFLSRRRDVLLHVQTSKEPHGKIRRRAEARPSERKTTRSAALSRDRGVRRSKRESAPRTSK